MSKGVIREDKTCLNCGSLVQDRFCPECGQENTETRKSFHYLFTHMVEDLVHYDNSFWNTIKYLLFHPARLTREYLSGRRKSFVIPIKLYIFISFITFFISGLMINVNDIGFNDDKNNPTTKFKKTPKKEGFTFSYKSDSVPAAKEVMAGKEVKKVIIGNENIEGKKAIINGPDFKEAMDSVPNDYEEAMEDSKEYGWVTKYKTVRDLDSIQNSLPEGEKLSKLEYWYIKRLVSVAEHNTIQEAFKKALELFIRNLPKVLFLYMPIFAFWLWLIHGKKRWYYFDHGIFTLHYFSFLLLLTSIFILLEWLLNKSDLLIFGIIQGVLVTIYMFWPIIYFYKAHKRLYTESKIISFLKSSTLFIINFITFWIILSLYSLYTFISIH